MKRNICLVAALMISASLIGCGSKVVDGPINESSTVSQSGPTLVENEEEGIIADNSTESYSYEPDEIFEESNTTVIASENGSNDNYAWEKTVTIENDDNKIQTIDLVVKANESDETVKSKIIVDYNEMTATCTSTVTIYVNDNDLFHDNNYTVTAEDTNGDIQSLIPDEVGEGFKDIIAQTLYTAFH